MVLRWFFDGCSKDFRGFSPFVLGRSNIGRRRRCNGIGRGRIFGACCARGRAHSGPVAFVGGTRAPALNRGRIKRSGSRTVPVRSGHDGSRVLWFFEHPGLILCATNRDGSRSGPERGAALTFPAEVSRSEEHTSE